MTENDAKMSAAGVFEVCLNYDETNYDCVQTILVLPFRSTYSECSGRDIDVPFASAEQCAQKKSREE